VAVLVALFVLAVVAVALPLTATSTPKFFSRYHLLQRRYVNLSGSAHEGIGCRVCHETQPIENGAALVGDFYAGLVKVGETPKYFKFAPPTNDACLQCHDEDWSHDATRTARIPHPAHVRVADETRPCTGCHKWTAHLETYMEKHKKMPFSGVCVSYGCHVGTKQPDQCYDCHHVLEQTAAEWDEKHPEVAMTAGESSCLESCHEVEQCQTCHTTGKKPDFGTPTIQVVPGTIEALHTSPDWTGKYHGTEALKNRDKCMICHQNQDECAECHRFRPAFHGKPLTWIGTHAKHTKDVADPRCIECHKKAFCEDCHAKFKEME